MRVLRTADLCKRIRYFRDNHSLDLLFLMIPYQQQAIPDWLQKEVEQYFIPLPFEPNSILDIGANIGAFSQRAHQQWPAAQIYCYEPMPFNLIQLRRNVPNNTTVVSAAVRAQSGLDEIFIGDNFVTGGFSQLGRQTQKKFLWNVLLLLKYRLLILLKSIPKEVRLKSFNHFLSK